MNMEWQLRKEDKMCDWILHDSNINVSFRITLDEFFTLVDSLTYQKQIMMDHMNTGMKPEDAIAEWEKMLSKKVILYDNVVKADPRANRIVALCLLVDNPSDEAWENTKKNVISAMMLQAQKEHKSGKLDCLISITMPCGNKFELKTYDDVKNLKKVNVLCPCGDPRHWFVFVEEVKRGVNNP